MARLRLIRDADDSVTATLGSEPTRIGRAPGNDLVVSDTTVSGTHALVWVEAGTVWAKDLASSNGTFLNERRIWGAQPLADGDRLRLGLTCEFVVDIGEMAPRMVAPRVLEDVKAGVCYAFWQGRAVMGPDSRIPCEASATVLLHADGEMWLGRDDGEGPIALREIFEVGGRQWRVIEGVGALAATDVPPSGPPPYRLTVTLDGAFGAEASVENLSSRSVCKIGAANRATVLFLLARRFQEDTAGGDERGWTPDDDVMSGVWGRKGDENKLNVLLHRLRSEVKAAGLDPWFIEKKHRFLRVRVAEVVIK